VIRADSGFENHKVMRALERAGVQFSTGVRQSKTIRALIAEIPEADWVTVADYPETGEAQIAETRERTDGEQTPTEHAAIIPVRGNTEHRATTKTTSPNGHRRATRPNPRSPHRPHGGSVLSGLGGGPDDRVG
jgi:hypothetical protein